MTLTAFIRETKKRRVRLELIERNGKTGKDIPQSLRGARLVLDANYKRFILVDKYGIEHKIDMPESTTLFEYTNGEVRIYAAAERDLTAEESREMLKWERKKRFFEHKNPNSDTFFLQRDFFSKSKFPWLEGVEVRDGKVYDAKKNKVIDYKQRNKIKELYKVT